MKRRSVAGVAALFGLYVAGGARAGCAVNDWPLDIPNGTDSLLRFVAPAPAVATHLTVVRLSAGPPIAASVAAPVHRASPKRPWHKRQAVLAARRRHSDDWDRLIYAIEDGDAPRTAAVLRSGRVDVNAPLNPETRETLLDLAAAGSQPEVVRLLLQHGAHVRAGSGGRTAVHPLASAMSHLEWTLDGAVRNPFTGADETPADSEAIIRMLLEWGADPDVPLTDLDDLTPLVSLMLMPRFDGDLALARLLVQHGAHVEGVGSGRSPLLLAIERGNQDYVQLFLGSARISPRGLTEALIAAARLQNGSLADSLLAAGADPNASADGQPLLCRALLFPNGQAIALALLTHGANPNADCDRPHIGESTPLTYAEYADHELIDQFVGRGGRLGVPDRDKADLVAHGVYPGPLIWAVLHHHDYLAGRLLARDPRSAQAECGLVVYAAAYGAKFTLAELFRHGADPNASTTSGITALMVAAYHGDVDVLKVLLAQPGIAIDRATPWHFNRDFFTPSLEGEGSPLRTGSRTALMFAALSGSPAAIDLLLSHGANAYQTDAEGLRAADYARNLDVARLLSAQ